MKFTQVFLQQHVGRMFREHWKVQGKRVLRDNGSIKALKEKNIAFEDALDIIKPKPIERPAWSFAGYKPQEVVYDKTHPDYHEDRCFSFENHNVLIEGLNQAKVLTNTVEVEAEDAAILKSILRSEEKLTIPDKLIRRCIRSSALTDATQEKLPIRKDPEREAWNFPRDYGITNRRRNRLLMSRLLQICLSACPHLLGKRTLLHSAKFQLPLQLPTGEKIIFNLTGDNVVVAPQGLDRVAEPGAHMGAPLPDIHPLTPTVSLEKKTFYKFEPHHPLNSGSSLSVHTVVFHYNADEVYNIHESPVTGDQVEGRTLLGAWTVAMLEAQRKYEDVVEDLPQPVVVQVVQTDGRTFNFSLFQLNSCSVSSERRNCLWRLPPLDLYQLCTYSKGAPLLTGYSPQPVSALHAFLNGS